MTKIKMAPFFPSVALTPRHHGCSITLCHAHRGWLNEITPHPMSYIHVTRRMGWTWLPITPAISPEQSDLKDRLHLLVPC